jgi:hypothetical protein
LKQFLGDACVSPDGGTRPLLDVLHDLIEPKVDQHEYAEDGHYVLELDPKLQELERNKLVTRFQAKQGIPDGVTQDNFPVTIRNVKARPIFSEYNGQVPYSPDGLLNLLGQGMVGRQSYAVLDKGDDSPVEMHFIKPGGQLNGKTVPDAYLNVKLRPELADTNYELQTTDIDVNRSYFLGTSLPDKGDEAEMSAFIYHAGAKSKGWVTAKPPPIALSGASMAAIDGKVYVFGGRDIAKVGDAWSPAPDIELNNGVPSQPLALEYDPDIDEWRVLDVEETAGFTPRANMATVVHDGKLFFIGGEEIEPGTDTLPHTKGSTVVEAYNPKTRKMETYPPLKAPVVGAIALSRGDTLEVLGGKVVELDRHSGFLQVQPQLAIQTLDTKSSSTTWKVRGDLALPASAIAGDIRAIPSVSGHIIGPFFESGNLKPKFYRYSVPPEA